MFPSIVYQGTDVEYSISPTIISKFTGTTDIQDTQTTLRAVPDNGVDGFGEAVIDKTVNIESDGSETEILFEFSNTETDINPQKYRYEIRHTDIDDKIYMIERGIFNVIEEI